ncbi:MAG TPA: J domain-containing protein [Candidatus Sulfotelmatobacter sp.]|nr:J domain-containing protein [Candidatus Sulfotelmatobacter sp.]
MDMALDPYKTLQVDAEADEDVIRAAYRRLALKYHPDSGETPERGRRMAELNAAWELLRDPQRRAVYDAERRAQLAGSQPARPAGPSVTTGSPTAPRTWGAAGPPRAESANPLWTSGRSDVGSGYDPGRMGRSQETGSAGPPPGRPSGSVLNFGRFAGWSLGEIGRMDIEYLEWLDRAPIGRQYQAELDQLLRQAGRRATAVQDESRRGLFRRR